LANSTQANKLEAGIHLQESQELLQKLQTAHASLESRYQALQEENEKVNEELKADQPVY